MYKFFDFKRYVKGEKMQLHIDIQDELLKQFKVAVKALGYHTMSEYIREKIRQAIRDALEKEASTSVA